MKLGLYGAVGSIFAVLLALNTSATGQGGFEKYKKIEGYEVRPGMLMVPHYTADNQVCEIGLQKLMYSPEVVRVDAYFESEEIDKVLDELVPADERGKRTDTTPGDLIVEDGPGLTTVRNFENVTIEINAGTFICKHKREFTGPVVATVKWKNRVCR